MRKFASQLFVSLQFLARPDVRVIHTDIKVTDEANLKLETLDPKPNLASDQRPDPQPPTLGLGPDLRPASPSPPSPLP